MAKLIVEEGGARRAFRMGKGVLTVGSGAEARLKLASTEVAEVHFELELGESGVTLRPRPGVVPPKVAGLPAQGERVLAPGQRVEVGGARLWVEDESAPAAPAAAPARPVSAPRSAGVERREARAPRRGGAPERERRGGKPWLVPVVVLALTGLAFLLWSNMIERGSTEAESVAQNRLRAAEQSLAAAKYDDARTSLAAVPASGLTPEQEARRARVAQALAEADANASAHFANEAGDKYMDVLLKKYEGRYLQGTPEPAKVRLFLKRCRTFRERWPTHPEMDWVARQERRFAGYVDMNAPMTWEDVQWEVKDLTDGMPRNYAAAFALLDELLPRVSGEEHQKAQNLRDELVKARPEYAMDRVYQAKHEFEKKQDTAKAVWWLVNNIAWLGDEALANESARLLEKMPDLPGHLLGYKKNYPDRYEAVMKNPVMRAWAEASGFTP